MTKKISVITIFPEMIQAYLGFSIMKRAVAGGFLSVDVLNLRDYTSDRHKSVDDYPYGGGAGMVMKPEPFFRLIESAWPSRDSRLVVMLSPHGKPFTQESAKELALDQRDIVLLCGRYEAIDERVRLKLVDLEFSLGDFILTGGELPALVIIDAVARLVPGVLGDAASAEEESFSRGMLEYPHYTRPEIFRDMAVPKELLSGNHREIAMWRKKAALRATLLRRPDLIDRAELTQEEKDLMNEIREELT